MQQYQGYPTPPAEEPGRKFTLILVALVVLVLAVAAVLYFVGPDEEVEVSVEEVVVEELKAYVLFTSSIDEDFTYEIQPNAEYEVGDTIYIYIGLINFKQEADLSVDISEDIEILDASGSSVFTQADFAVLKTAYVDQINYVRFKNMIPTISLEPGRYTAKIKINDNLAGTSVIEETEFSLVEKSTEIVENVIDLSEIISENLEETQLIRQQTIWNPDGSILQEITFNQTISGDLADIDLSKIDASMKIPDRFDGGVYTIEIKYINLANGKFVSVKDTFEVVKELSIDELIFVSSIDEVYNYEIQPNAVYSLGDTIYVYMKLVDFAQPLVDGEYSVKFVEDVAVFDANGNELYLEENYIEVDDLNNEKKDNYDIKNIITTGNLPAGKYIYKAVVEDLNTNKQTIREENFWLE